MVLEDNGNSEIIQEKITTLFAHLNLRNKILMKLLLLYSFYTWAAYRV